MVYELMQRDEHGNVKLLSYELVETKQNGYMKLKLIKVQAKLGYTPSIDLGCFDESTFIMARQSKKNKIIYIDRFIKKETKQIKDKILLEINPEISNLDEVIKKHESDKEKEKEEEIKSPCQIQLLANQDQTTAGDAPQLQVAEVNEKQ